MSKFKVTFEARIWEERIIEADSYPDAWQKAHVLAGTDEALLNHDYEPESVRPLRRDPYPYATEDENTRYPEPEVGTEFKPRGGYLQDREDYE